MAIKVVDRRIELTRTYKQTLTSEQVAERKRDLNMELAMLEQEYVQRRLALEEQLAELGQMETALLSAGVKLGRVGL